MSIQRSIIRIPALLSVLLLLFTGVREAYAFGLCPMMHVGGEAAEVAPVESAEPVHAHHHHPSPEGDLPDHSGHGAAGHGAAGEGDTGRGAPGHGGSGQGVAGHSSSSHGASGHANSGHGEEGCQCRVLCVTVSAPTPPQTVTLTVTPLFPTSEAGAHSTEEQGLLPTLHHPHILPFANAPPTHF